MLTAKVARALPTPVTATNSVMRAPAAPFAPLAGLKPSRVPAVAAEEAAAQEGEADRAAERAGRLPLGRSGPSREGSEEPGSSGSSSAELLPGERARLGRIFNRDFRGVRIHSGTPAREIADALGAEAFTVGSDIYVGAHAPRRGTRESDRLLAHELSHVVQQSLHGLKLQPKLKITGTPVNVGRVVALLNSGLYGHQVAIDRSGDVSISANDLAGPPAATQFALLEHLTKVINDPGDVVMTVSSGSATLGGSYATGDFDIADLETYGVGGLIHEIEEQYQKQVKGRPFGSETTGAHSEAIKAESEVTGAQRGPQHVVSSTNNPDGTIDAVVEIPWTFPDGSVRTQTLHITANNIVSATWT